MNKLLTDIEKAGFKKRLLNKCIRLIEERIAATAGAIANAQDAANSEEKSSAGDKYETSRAMSHLEKDMHSRQLAANQIELAALFSIDCSTLNDSATAGSFIQCDDYSFFIAAGLGKLHFEERDIYVLSPNAPVAKLLFKKKQDDIITFNKMEIIIQAVF
ncbi:MAG: hypothetical protein ABI707_17435 [Ferruginibacter sp.]